MPQSLFVFILVYILSFFFVMGGDGWFLIWLGLEINMISFVSVIYSRSMSSVESCLKYFFVQSIGSGVLLGIFYFGVDLYLDLVSMVLVYKMGAGPFFFWFPPLCEGVSWVSCFVLMTFQKIMPMMLVSFSSGMINWAMVFFSMLVGVVGSFGEVSLSKLMAYSSVHHVGWILMCNYLGMMYWLIYLFFYMLMLMMIIYIFYFEEKFNLVDLVNLKAKWLLVLMLFNMGGLPPMLGFFMKWWVFYNMVGNLFIYMWMMIILSVCMLYIYIRIIYGILGGIVSFSVGELNYLSSGGVVMTVLIFSFFIGAMMFII